MSNLSVVETDCGSSDLNGNLVVSGLITLVEDITSDELLDLAVIDTD